MPTLERYSITGRAGRGFCLLVLMLELMTSNPSEAATASPEYQLKAAIIFKLSKFVEWPSETSVKQPQRFSICILGEDPFDESIDALRNKKVEHRPIEIFRFARSDVIDVDCQMLFVSRSKKAFEERILEELKGLPILTLGESRNFADHGGMLQFTREDKRIGFKINLSSVKESELEIAAPLLAMATVIESDPASAKP